MSFLMGALLRLQRQQQAFEELVAAAPSLGLPEASLDRIAGLLRESKYADLRGLLLGSGSTDRQLGADLLVESTAARLLTDPLGPDALSAYPLDSPKMLGATRAHGVNERVLREVSDQLDLQRR